MIKLNLCHKTIKKINIELLLLLSQFLLITWIDSERSLSASEFTEHKVIYENWQDDQPGRWRHIKIEDMPVPFSTDSSAIENSIISRPSHTKPNTINNFQAELFAFNLSKPRSIRIAPNGDVFIVETGKGQIRSFRLSDDKTQYVLSNIYAQNLAGISSIAFYPSGPKPKFIYVGLETTILRYSYRNGDLIARSDPEIIYNKLPAHGHWTRDLSFSKNNRRLFIGVGSATNVAEELIAHNQLKNSPTPHNKNSPSNLISQAEELEKDRATVIALSPNGKHREVYATGIRNCAALTLHPNGRDVWCVVNERDLLGDNLPPDYVTRVKKGAFYGWPWYYIGNHRDPRHLTHQHNLHAKIAEPDVLLQAHSAPVAISFYAGAQFPHEFNGDAFVALHGSWNRTKKTGFKVVRLKFVNGHPTGEYQDFVTGFVIDNTHIWGRPSSIAVMPDGALLVAEDANGEIWRISYRGHK